MGTEIVQTKWFFYRQNNSGGSFSYDENAGISAGVLIEALDADHADTRARQIGLYFDGTDSGRDCNCCGDRWNSALDGWRTDEYDAPPDVYWAKRFDFDIKWMKGYELFIHPLNAPMYGTLKTDPRSIHEWEA